MAFPPAQSPVHTSKVVCKKLMELEGNELLPNLPYSSDLASTDYNHFHSMTHFFRGWEFNPLKKIEVCVRDILSSKSREWYCHGLLTLAQWCQKTIESDGMYFQCDVILCTLYIINCFITMLQQLVGFCISLNFTAQTWQTFDSLSYIETVTLINIV